VANIYANENFPQPSVERLRALGYDVLTTWESGSAGQAISDAEVLAFAKEHRRVLIIFNRKHFIWLRHKNSAHVGVVVCTVDSNFEALAERIHAAFDATPDMTGRLIRLRRFTYGSCNSLGNFYDAGLEFRIK
jgi:hypothetical protein